VPFFLSLRLRNENLISQLIFNKMLHVFEILAENHQGEKDIFFNLMFFGINSAHVPDRNRGHNLTLTKAISSDQRDLQAPGERAKEREEDTVPGRREYLL